jgi:hypothetical protein
MNIDDIDEKIMEILKPAGTSFSAFFEYIFSSISFGRPRPFSNS